MVHKMPRSLCNVCLIWVGLLATVPNRTQCAEPNYGLERRTAWTESNIHGFPDAPPPWKLVVAYPQLKQIRNLITLGRIPKSDWILAVDHEKDYGGPSRAVQFEDIDSVSETHPFLETPEIIYGLAFHPDFQTNRWVYVGCNGRSETLDAVATRVLRFHVVGDGPFHCEPDSRTLIIEWKSDGHNGGDLEFGRDGMLYVSTGDGTSDSDVNRNGQNLSTLPGSMLRIDVDHVATEDGQPGAYSIPADNPFVGFAGARGEIWAYGLRNPWRIAYDAQTNQLWAGNNGQDLWESVYLVQRGANYGWSINESNHPFHTQQDAGPVAISPATWEHHHSEARSLTGGHVYRGSLFPELEGAYIYGDYSTGTVWAIRHDGQRVVFQQRIARSRVQIADFGVDSRGEILIADHQGSIFRLAQNDVEARSTFPKKLSRTGLFEEVATQRTTAGVIPYSVNSALWSDGAVKQRWLAVPDSETIGFTSRGAWSFPDGTVLMKSFGFPTAAEDGNSSSAVPAGNTSGGGRRDTVNGGDRRATVSNNGGDRGATLGGDRGATLRLVETRLLAKQQGEWYGYSYRWNAEQSDADLVDDAGRDEVLDWVVEDGRELEIRWRYPGRSECMVCHSRAANFVLGLTTEQMHRSQAYPQPDNSFREAPQIATLAHIGMFGDTWNPSLANEELPSLVDPYDVAQDLSARARSYLHTNCASCHVMSGGGNSKIDLSFFASLDKTNLIDAVPLHSSLGIEGSKLVSPGAPQQSVLHARIGRRGEGQMPPLATHRVDDAAVDLIRRWISELE